VPRSFVKSLNSVAAGDWVMKSALVLAQALVKALQGESCCAVPHIVGEFPARFSIYPTPRLDVLRLDHLVQNRFYPTFVLLDVFDWYSFRS
jgi:hypothetical protein